MAPVASAPGEAEPLGPAEGQPGQGTGFGGGWPCGSADSSEDSRLLALFGGGKLFGRLAAGLFAGCDFDVPAPSFEASGPFGLAGRFGAPPLKSKSMAHLG